MNKVNAKDYLPLVQALAEGKVIQIARTRGGWTDVDEIHSDNDPINYRIKPEPREVWVNRHIDGHNSDITYESKESAECGVMHGWFSVRYREVIE